MNCVRLFELKILTTRTQSNMSAKKKRKKKKKRKTQLINSQKENLKCVVLDWVHRVGKLDACPLLC